jgi:hypothetical protein
MLGAVPDRLKLVCHERQTLWSCENQTVLPEKLYADRVVVDSNPRLSWIASMCQEGRPSHCCWTTNFPPCLGIGIKFHCESSDGCVHAGIARTDVRVALSRSVRIGLHDAKRFRRLFKDPGSYSRRIRRRSFCVAFFYQVRENEKEV